MFSCENCKISWRLLLYSLLSNLMWQDAISLYLLSRANQENWLLLEKLKINYSLKRKKQPVGVIRVCSKKQPARVILETEVFLIFINIQIVGNLKYTNGLQPLTSLKSELLHRYYSFSFLLELLLKMSW